MNKIRGFEFVSKIHKKYDEEILIQLPVRATKFSAGYDFFSPIDVIIPPLSKLTIWTDVKSYMQNGEVLLLDVRSSIGIKKGLKLANTIGVIDADYYSNIDNDGNIGICLENSNPYKEIEINAGERIAQGIFISYLVADNGNSDNERVGGVGSTNQTK